jgi:hypothetical protein
MTTTKNVDVPPGTWTDVLAGVTPVPAKFVLQNLNDRYGDDIIVATGVNAPPDESLNGKRVKALCNTIMADESKVWVRPVAGRHSEVRIREKN